MKSSAKDGLDLSRLWRQIVELRLNERVVDQDGRYLMGSKASLRVCRI